MTLLGRAIRFGLLLNGGITLLAFLTATEGCHARLPFALPLSRVSDFVADSRGHVFVHSDFHRAVTEYDARGRFVQNLAVPGGSGRGLLAVDARDRLYVNKADLLTVFEPGGRAAASHPVPLGGERSWRLLPDGRVSAEAGPVADTLAWTLRSRRAVAPGEVLFVDWGRRRRPMGVLGNVLLEDPFTGPDGSHYEYRGFLRGVVRLPPAPPGVAGPPGPAPGHAASGAISFRPLWVVALFTHPYSLVAWLLVPAIVFRARRARARRQGTAGAGPGGAAPPRRGG